MNLKGRLTVLSFLQFFVWGAWLITIATYFSLIIWAQEPSLGQSFRRWPYLL